MFGQGVRNIASSRSTREKHSGTFTRKACAQSMRLHGWVDTQQGASIVRARRDTPGEKREHLLQQLQ